MTSAAQLASVIDSLADASSILIALAAFGLFFLLIEGFDRV